MNHFIRRQGDRLYDGNEEFRFVSINIPNLHVNEDPLPYWHRVQEWELRDAFRTLQLLGGRATRIYTLSIVGGIRPGEQGRTHIKGPGQYDEELFGDLDLVLKLANEYGIRIIIPFIDRWDWFGGIGQYTALFGKPAESFWTDPEIVEAFEDTLCFVLNRVNTLTGIPYKEDKAILAWETGNEINPPDEWTARIASHLKKLDPNHLVMDGKGEFTDDILRNPDVDIVTTHYYEDAHFRTEPLKQINRCRGKRPFFVGEYFNCNRELMTHLLNTVIEEGAVGAMLWSLRYRNAAGGFYFQGDPNDPHSHVFNWPAHPAHRDGFNVSIMEELRHAAYRIQGMPVPRLPIPEPPFLLRVGPDRELVWQGSAGAEWYAVERAAHSEGPWETICEPFYDGNVPFKPFRDTSPNGFTSWFYRVCAVNRTGRSIPSLIGHWTAKRTPVL